MAEITHFWRFFLALTTPIADGLVLRTQLIDGSLKFPDFLSRNLAAANQDYTTKSAAAPATI